MSKAEFKVSKCLYHLVVSDSGMDPGDDNVEVNHFPCNTLTHSESRNTGSTHVLNKLCLMTLMPRVWFWMSLQVSSWLGVSILISKSSSLIQANIDLSAPFLPGVISGSVVSHTSLILYLTTAPASLG